MQAKHYLFLAIIFIIGYFVGIKFPGIGGKITGTVQSVSP